MFQHAWMRPARMMRAKAVKVTGQKEIELECKKPQPLRAAAAMTSSGQRRKVG
jgi:hypothetical protein